MEGGEGHRLFQGLEDRIIVCRRPADAERTLSSFKPDFLLSLDTPQICNCLAALPPETAFVYEAHSTYPETLSRLKQLHKYNVAAVLTPSRAQRELVASLLGESLDCLVKVVPNPLRPGFAHESETPQHSRPIVLWVGRLDAHKNWRFYLEICRRLHAAGAEFEYWLVGTSKNSPAEKEHLWRQVKEGGWAGRFRWLPSVHYEKIDRLYRFAAASGGCLVSTSRQESFGMAAAEAMACSCPVVVPDVGGFRDFVVSGETGCRYPPDDLSAATRDVLRSIRDLPSRPRIIAAGRRRVLDEYSAGAVVDKLIDTLQELKSGKN